MRGRIIAKGLENNGYSSYTLFHHCELETGNVTGLSGRCFSWTGIPRLTDPANGAPINDWRTLHHAHALSSVVLSTEHNSPRIAGVLHEVCAETNSDEFNIYSAHGETVHAYHGERPLLRIASCGDHLCWVVQGAHELSHTALSGKWTRYENGVEQGTVQMVVHPDMSFTITDD